MPRGSKPGERRGGRERATPNKRTVLTNKILAVASGNPNATRHELVLILIKDKALPAGTRMAIARKSFPARTSRAIDDGAEKSVVRRLRQIKAPTDLHPDPGVHRHPPSSNRTWPDARTGPINFATLDLLLSVAQDAAATPSERHKAASELAQHFLPKTPGRNRSRRSKFLPDERGFVVDPDLARELRDSKLKLACLPLAEKLTPYAVALRASKLQARIREIQQSLQCPCPSRYRTTDVKRDGERLASFSLRRASRSMLTLDEDTEEAVRTARYDSFWEGPEVAARQRLADLCAKKRAADNQGPPLTHAQAASFRLLTLLYSNPRETDEKTKAEHAFWNLPVISDEPAPDDDIEEPAGHAATREEAIVFARDLKQAMPGRNWSDWFVPIMDAHGNKIGEVAVADV